MKKVIIIIAIFIAADLLAGYFISKNIDFSTVDEIGRHVTPTPDTSTEAISSAIQGNKVKDSTVYVECEIDGVKHVVSAKECQQAREHFSEMAP